LLDNALEYNGPGGRVELSCELSGDEMTLAVRDTGLGIRADVLPHVFEPFFRGDDARAAEGGGHCGLGLYLVKSHVDALGGTCAVRSTRGSGSEFTIRLPRQPAAGKVVPSRPTSRPGATLSPTVP
jgi:two-component system sensor histidine kinase BaeS